MNYPSMITSLHLVCKFFFRVDVQDSSSTSCPSTWTWKRLEEEARYSELKRRRDKDKRNILSINQRKSPPQHRLEGTRYEEVGGGVESQGGPLKQ